MTTMFTDWFGVPHEPLRSGLWAQMKPSQRSLYIGLLYESERYSTRELARSDKQLRALTGVSPRAQRDARTKLQEFGLIEVHLQPGGVYRYVLCDPATGKPYPGDPGTPIPYPKKAAPVSVAPDVSPSSHPVVAPRVEERSQKPDQKVMGVPLKW